MRRETLYRFACVSTALWGSACTGTIGDERGNAQGAGASGATGSGSAVSTGAGGAGAQPTTTTGGGPSGGAGGAGGAPAKPGSVLVRTSRMARLSQWQWLLSVKDLLKLPDIGGLETQLTKDAVLNFDNEAEALRIGQDLRADLQTVSEKLAQRVVADPVAVARIVPANAPSTLPAKGRAFITAFGARAYRRPLEPMEIDEAVALFNQATTLLPGMDPFLAGVDLLLEFFLQSPHFLYRTELSTEVANGKIALSDYEVASKLSYALAGTMPDDTLAAKAAAGELETIDEIAAQVDRLLSSPAGLANLEHFHFQVLKLGGYPGMTKDQVTFPKFTPDSPLAMSQETTAFLDWIFGQNMGLKDAFTQPVTFVNSALAPIYGIAGPFTSSFVKVDLDSAQRAGLLTQLGFLALHAHEKEIDTIHRGVFILQRLLCVQLAPPANVQITPVPPSDGMSTNRQRLTAHTGPGTCGAGCHATIINPVGFAFEKYDAIGAFRTTDGRQPIDATGDILVDGTRKAFDGAIEFGRILAEHPDAHTCYSSNWMSYLFGRKVDAIAGDAPIVQFLSYQSLRAGMSTKDMIRTLATTDNFLARLPGGP